MSAPRCPECGSWERQCISPVPIADCGCNRCMRVELCKTEAWLAKARELLVEVQPDVRVAVASHEAYAWCPGMNAARKRLKRIDAFLAATKEGAR